jgi:hypothetical protein
MCLINLFVGNTVNKLYNQPIGIIMILLVLYIFKTSIFFFWIVDKIWSVFIIFHVSYPATIFGNVFKHDNLK